MQNAKLYTPNYNQSPPIATVGENTKNVYNFEYPIVRAYSSISSLVNLSCPLQFAELLLGRNVLCPLRLLFLKISSMAGGLISPKTSSGLIICWRFNWAIRIGDSAHDGFTIDGFLGESSSESEYLGINIMEL